MDGAAPRSSLDHAEQRILWCRAGYVSSNGGSLGFGSAVDLESYSVATSRDCSSGDNFGWIWGGGEAVCPAMQTA